MTVVELNHNAAESAWSASARYHAATARDERTRQEYRELAEFLAERHRRIVRHPVTQRASCFTLSL